MTENSTIYDGVMKKLKNNRFIVILLLAVPSYLALSSVIEATDKNLSLIEDKSIEDSTSVETQELEKKPKPLAVRAYIETGAKKLQMCCGVTGKRQEVVIHAINYEQEAELVVANITISWIGGITGAQYAITGNLIFDYDGSNPTWSRLGQKGMMQPGCASSCNLGHQLKY